MNRSILDRLGEAADRVITMCRQNRGPTRTIPAREDDDDIFLTRTITEASSRIVYLQDQVAMRDETVRNLEQMRNYYRGEVERLKSDLEAIAAGKADSLSAVDGGNQDAATSGTD